MMKLNYVLQLDIKLSRNVQHTVLDHLQAHFRVHRGHSPRNLYGDTVIQPHEMIHVGLFRLVLFVNRRSAINSVTTSFSAIALHHILTEKVNLLIYFFYFSIRVQWQMSATEAKYKKKIKTFFLSCFSFLCVVVDIETSPKVYFQA